MATADGFMRRTRSGSRSWAAMRGLIETAIKSERKSKFILEMFLKIESRKIQRRLCRISCGNALPFRNAVLNPWGSASDRGAASRKVNANGKAEPFRTERSKAARR